MNLSVLTYARQGWQVPIGLGLPTLTRAQLILGTGLVSENLLEIWFL